MDFQLVFEKVISSFEEENLQYGLIGGFALEVMGILRATMDIDILLLVDDLDKADRILTGSMYSCVHRSPEDIIGLKVQAIANDAQRESTDIHDMRLLLEYQMQRKMCIDWELLDEYFSLFNKQALLATLKKDFS